VVKVVLAKDGKALYFSRASIPYPRGFKAPPAGPSFGRHVGLYAYRVAFLRKILKTPPSPLEKLEKLEQLRVLEMGESILVGRTRRRSDAVDTPADAARIRRKIK
jgi:3-deoxy-manno-octulosonate cytidylyltransferase (CMP-KDO synthetase)